MLLSLSLWVSSLSLVASHKLDGAQFGSKSSYFSVANTDDSSLENYEECEPMMMWMYIRHGSRNPGDDEILEMKTLLPALRDEIVAAWDDGAGSMTGEEIAVLKDWRLNLDVSEEKLLTKSGRREGLEMGQRWKKRLPSLFKDSDNIESRSSYKSRSIETGNNFLKGVVDAEETHPPIAVDNSKGIYYKGEYGCAKYVQEVYDNDNVTDAEAIKFTESQAWAAMLEGVSNRTGVEMSPDLTKLAHKMCKYQLAWEPERLDNPDGADYPPWCNIFTKKDTELFEFENDLEAYYGSGNAYEITTMAPHHLFTEIYSLIDAHGAGGQKPNASVVLTFGHSGGIKPLINAFEHVRDDWHLKASDWGTEKQEHKWKISDIGTFASNIGLILFQCSKGAERKVMMVHNEHIIKEQPACGETLCSVQDFKNKYQHIVDFDFETGCKVEAPTEGEANEGIEHDSDSEASQESDKRKEEEDKTEGDDSDEDSDEDESDEDDSDEEDSDESSSDEDSNETLTFLK